MCFTGGFDRTDTMKIGLQFEGSALLPDLYTGMTFAFLKAQGKVFLLCINYRHM